MNIFLEAAIEEAMNLHPQNDDPHERTVASATQLVAPIQQVILTKRYNPKKDPKRCIKLFSGTAIHELVSTMINQIDLDKWIKLGYKVRSEERLFAEFGGHRVGGSIDIQYQHDGEDAWGITDLKTTSVFTVMRMSRIQEWTEQVNVYAELVHKNGRKVKNLDIETVLLDWSAAVLKQEKAKAKKNRKECKYPHADCVTIPIELWPQPKRESWITEHVQAIVEAEKLPDNKLPRCGDVWGGKRCQQYCDCVPHCAQYQKKLQVEKEL